MTERILDTTLYGISRRIDDAVGMLNRNTIREPGEVRMLDTRFEAIMAELHEATRSVAEVRASLRQEGITSGS